MKSEIVKSVKSVADLGLRPISKAELSKLKKEAAAKKKKK